LLAGSVDGSFRDAVKTLEVVSFHKGNITEEIIRSLVSLTDASIVTKFLEAVEKKELPRALKIISQLVSDGIDIKTFLTNCLTVLESNLLSGKNVSDIIGRFTEAYGLMKISPIAQLPLEVAVVEYCGVVIPTKPEGRLEESHTQKVIEKDPSAPASPAGGSPGMTSLGLLTLEKLTEHWTDFIAELKPYNHSVAAVLRSARPKSVEHGIVTIEAFYPFHKDKLSESKTKDILVTVLKKLFGEKVKVEIVLGKK